MIDLLPMEGPFSDAIVDLKETHDPSDHKTPYILWDFEYHMKLAYYCLLAEAAGLGARTRGVLIWQRDSWPYDVHVREIPQKAMHIGRQMCVNRMNRLLAMDATDMRPHFDVELKEMNFPEWMEGASLL
jgi:hypothetical protein